MLLPALQAQGLEHLLQPLLVHLPSVHQNRQGDILRYIEHGDQIVKLVNESHLPAAKNGQLILVPFIHILSIHVHRTTGRPVYTAQNVQKCAFPRP